MEKRYEELSKYFAFDKKKTSIEEFFGDISSFFKDFEVWMVWKCQKHLHLPPFQMHDMYITSIIHFYYFCSTLCVYMYMLYIMQFAAHIGTCTHFMILCSYMFEDTFGISNTCTCTSINLTSCILFVLYTACQKGKCKNKRTNRKTKETKRKRG